MSYPVLSYPIPSVSFHITSHHFVSPPPLPPLLGSYPGFTIDVEAELAYYNSIREEILEMTIDTIQYSNQALKDGKSILIEGANATSTYAYWQLMPYYLCLRE